MRNDAVALLERAARKSAATAVATAAWYAERRLYSELLRRKREEFWLAKVESERSSPRQLWRSVDALYLVVAGYRRQLLSVLLISIGFSTRKLPACVLQQRTLRHRRSLPVRLTACSQRSVRYLSMTSLPRS
jgi:hypothetical protein